MTWREDDPAWTEVFDTAVEYEVVGGYRRIGVIKFIEELIGDNGEEWPAFKLIDAAGRLDDWNNVVRWRLL